jgi:tRNA pseudouridine55 synthase
MLKPRFLLRDSPNIAMADPVPTIDAPFGFVNLRKMPGRTSSYFGFDVRNVLQAHYGIKGNKKEGLAIGHIGTLDPGAQGVLPIAVGKATRLIQFIDSRVKLYSFALVLGTSTSTGDASGELRETARIPEGVEKLLEEVLPKFHGPLQQIPPMVSAVHHNGKRLYELAREGITVDREPRNFEIFSVSILGYKAEGPDGEYAPSVRLRVKCSEGTYIRSLCEDIAKAIGTVGHMDELLREASGPFVLENTLRMADIVRDPKSAIIDPREVISLSEIVLNEEEYTKFCHGIRISVADRVADCEAIFAVVPEPVSETRHTRIVGVAQVEEGILVPRVVFA